MKIASAIAVLLIAVAAARAAEGYRLPAYEMSADERAVPSDEVLSGLKVKLDALGSEVNLSRLDEHRRNPKMRLTPAERRALAACEELKVSISFWERVDSLKRDLEGLWQGGSDREIGSEADAMAKIVIETLYELSQEWRVGSSALIRNFMINVGAKSEGFCYQYVQALWEALSRQGFRAFDLHWGVAWKGNFRENNSLVITAKGRPFEEGLAIDAWRAAGRPYWTPVRGDRFPWREEFDVPAE